MADRQKQRRQIEMEMEERKLQELAKDPKNRVMKWVHDHVENPMKATHVHVCVQYIRRELANECRKCLNENRDFDLFGFRFQLFARLHHDDDPINDDGKPSPKTAGRGKEKNITVRLVVDRRKNTGSLVNDQQRKSLDSVFVPLNQFVKWSIVDQQESSLTGGGGGTNPLPEKNNHGMEIIEFALVPELKRFAKEHPQIYEKVSDPRTDPVALKELDKFIWLWFQRNSGQFKTDEEAQAVLLDHCVSNHAVTEEQWKTKAKMLEKEEEQYLLEQQQYQQRLLKQQQEAKMKKQATTN